MKRTFAASLIALSCANSAVAAEADHYSWSQPLEDSAERVNEIANAYLAEGLEKLNAAGRCDSGKKSETALYGELATYFANHSKGRLVKDLLNARIEGVETRAISIEDSIYKGWSMSDGVLLGRPGASKSSLGLSPLIRIGDTHIGVDKFEHMFGMGRIYFQSRYLKGNTLLSVLKGGILREKTTLGGNRLATGVFSYGDLAANFNGLRFWNHVLQKRDDVLGKAYNIGPYVRCSGGEWVTTENRIDFRAYVDASMDESVNCRKFATKGGLERSKRAMAERDNDPDACPDDANLALEMYRKYGGVILEEDPKKRPLAHWIINLDGMGTVDYFREFKKKSILMPEGN